MECSLFFLISLFVLWLSAQIGASVRKRRALKEDEREDFGVVQAATLTLLALIIGFSFSMAVTRYDLRKTYEEAEANAIGTEYVRAGLLPEADAAAVRAQLTKYLDLRILFYQTRDENALRQINGDTAQLQTEMWSAVQAVAAARPTPVTALAVSGMNDVLNSQGYTQAARADVELRNLEPLRSTPCSICNCSCPAACFSSQMTGAHVPLLDQPPAREPC